MSKLELGSADVRTARHVHGRSARSADQRGLVVAGVFLALLAVTVQTALYLADVYAFDRRVGTFDIDTEHGLPAWAATVATFSTGFVALLLSLIELSRRLRLSRTANIPRSPSFACIACSTTTRRSAAGSTSPVSSASPT
jgi:hypothetical protein